ncbi:MAG: hypothetical protein JWO15_3877 [Sphingomonadales bacterium]|nr:hypothetical protein [Sphingomonadales bacterium]
MNHIDWHNPDVIGATIIIAVAVLWIVGELVVLWVQGGVER